MTKPLFAIVLILTSTFSFGQSDNSDIKMTSEHGSKNSEMTNLLMFQNIDYFKVGFTGKDLSKRYFSVLAKEMWDGRTLSLTLFGPKGGNHKKPAECY